MQVVGNYAYVADGGSGLQIIDVSIPILKGNYDTPGSALDVSIVGNYAYVADYNSGLQIIDISNPSTPTLKGNYDTPGEAWGVSVVGNYAYVADNASGLQIIDISNPSTPTLKGNYDTFMAYGVSVVGNYAYVADTSELKIIDISNPSTPTLKGVYDTPAYAVDVSVVGNYAYVADNASGLQIIDISNPSAPTLKGNYDTPDYAGDVSVVGNYAYVADRASGLRIIDINNPSTPTLKGNYDTPGFAETVSVVGNYAYVADGNSGLQIIDVSDLSTPVTPVVTLAVSPTSVFEDGIPNLVYTFTRTGLTTNALTVNYSVGGTATFNTDYIQTGAASFSATTGTVTFTVGSSTATVTVNPTTDTTVEPEETVALNLVSGTGYTIGTAAIVTGNITNDDGVILSIPDNFSAVPGSTITVPVEINNATGIQSLDFTLNYNTAFLNLTAVNLGSLTSSFTPTPNINDANGTASVSLFGTTPITSGAGSVAQLTFAVASNATNGSNIPLDLVTASINEKAIATSLDDGSISLTPPSLQVTNFQITPSGFTIQLSDSLNASVLNLYDGADVTNDLPDLTLVGATKGNIKGSVIWNEPTRTLTFVKTGGLLETDNYTITLASRTDGFIKKNNGDLLDGDSNGVAGGNYTRTFSVGDNTARVLSLPDFSRGIAQAVDVPAGDSVFGLPVRIDNASGVTAVDFTLRYDSNLLALTGVNLAANISPGWQINSNFNTPGQASFSLSGTNALTSTNLTDLLFLTGQVKSTATYGSSGLLQITSTAINGGAISSVGDSAVQLVALFGDATGNRDYSGLDASRIARVGVGTDSGFDPFPLTDPTIIGDITGNGVISGLDASRVAQRAVGISVPAIPI